LVGERNVFAGDWDSAVREARAWHRTQPISMLTMCDSPI
jgi:hypothetical protein